MNHNPIPNSFANDHQVNREALPFFSRDAKGGEALPNVGQRFEATLRSWLTPISLVPLLSLTRELAHLLVPVQLRPEFRAALRHSLMASARQQYAQRVLFMQESDRRSRLAWLPGRGGGGERITSKHLALGAVVVGSAVSLFSILALTVRYYRRQAASSSGSELGTM